MRQPSSLIKAVVLAAFVVLMVQCMVDVSIVLAQAANPWEAPLADISASLIGPVALAAFLIGLCFFCFSWWLGFAGIGAAVGLVVAGAIIGNAEGIASWLGIGG
jgi:type IV secretory pathway VirB2 component (pilin)